MRLLGHSHTTADSFPPTESEEKNSSFIEPSQSGQKGGQVDKGPPENGKEPISLVDFLWRHRDD